MNWKITALAAVVVALVLGAWGINAHRSATLTSPMTSDGAELAGSAADPRQAALRESPQVREYRDRQAFEASSKNFLRDAATMGPVERLQKARALSTSIDQYEHNGGLSAGEALLLRSALIKATVADETRQAEQLAELAEHYRSDAEQRMQAYALQHAQDPEFQDYKARERNIVAEVMAMQQIPGGLSRNEYLRQRLEQARESAYR
ncbi:MAG: hypothetical protein ABI538_07900 [Pseudoxanthomonas sp.]